MELEHFGYPEANRKVGNLGMAMLSEAVSAGAGRLSSAATEIRKNIGVKKST